MKRFFAKVLILCILLTSFPSTASFAKPIDGLVDENGQPKIQNNTEYFITNKIWVPKGTTGVKPAEFVNYTAGDGNKITWYESKGALSQDSTQEQIDGFFANETAGTFFKYELKDKNDKAIMNNHTGQAVMGNLALQVYNPETTAKPTLVTPIKAGDTIIKGMGIPNGKINLVLNVGGNSDVNTHVNDIPIDGSGNWSYKFADTVTLAENDKIMIRQIPPEFNQPPSAFVEATVEAAPVKHTVTFNTDGGTEVAPVEVNHGEKVTKPTPDPTKEGYKFDKWQKGGADYDFETPVTEATVLTAKWEAAPVAKHTVTFNTDGGTAVPSVEVIHGEKVAKPATDPTKANHRFDKWQKDGADYDFNTAVNENITLKATWVEQVSVTFKDPSGDKVVVIDKGTSVGDKMPGDPNQVGKVFRGWGTIEGGIVNFSRSTLVNKHMTLYPIWDKASHYDEYSYIYTWQPSGGQDNSGKKRDQLIVDLHYAYMVGYPDGNFRPQKDMTRAEAAVMFTRLMSKSGKVEGFNNSFKDINSNDWYASSVNYLVSQNILKGYENGEFRPNSSITRAEFTAIASRLANQPTSTGHNFSDVTNNHWAKDVIANASASGWIKGYEDGTFGTEKNISRAEVVAVVNRIMNRQGDIEFVRAHLTDQKLIQFRDVQDPLYWAYGHIMEATNGHDFIRKVDSKSEIWEKLNGRHF